MTLRAYCDAAYTLILAEYQRLGIALDEALEKLADWAVSYGKSEQERQDERLARQNERELRRLEQMMAGFGA